MNIIKTTLILSLFICTGLTLNCGETLQNTTDTNSVKIQYIETESKAKATDTTAIDSTTAISTTNELTWWDKYAEPAIVVFVAAISSLLLFGVRSK